MATFPQQTFAGKKRSAMEYEHGGANFAASMREPKRVRFEGTVEQSQPANVLAGTKRTAGEFDDNDEEVTACTHDVKRLRTETGSSHPTSTGGVDKADWRNQGADRPMHAPGSRPLPQMGRTLQQFPPITQPLPPRILLHQMPTYFPNHLQGHFLRPFIKKGWTWNQVFGCMDLRAMQALAQENGLEHNMGGSVIKARYEEETRKMAEEEVQTLIESTKERTEQIKPASPALPAVPAEDALPSVGDLSAKEWQALLLLEVSKNKKIFEDDLGFPDKSTAITQMEEFWNRQTQAFEDRALEQLNLEANEITTPRGNLRKLLIRMNEMLTKGCYKHSPAPTNISPQQWRGYLRQVGQWVLRTQLLEIRSWTELLEEGSYVDCDPRGPARVDVMPGEFATTSQLGASLGNGAFTEPSSNIPRSQGQSRQHEPQLGYGDNGLPENQQTGRRSGSGQIRRAHGRRGSEQSRAVENAAAGYGNGHPNSAVTYPAFTSVQTQPTSVVTHAHLLANVAHPQAPAQAGQAQPARKRPGAPRRKMFLNAPNRDTPLPQSALTDNREILNRFPEHLSHPVIMQRFVASPKTGSRGYHTTDMVNALLQHVNTRDFNGITEGERKENIRRWVVKERDACNKRLKAGRVLASLPPGMIAPPPPAQPGVQATQPNFAGMPMPLQNVQASPSYAGMHIPPSNLQAPRSVVSMPMPLQGSQAPANYAGMHIPQQNLQAPPDSMFTPLSDLQAPPGIVSIPMPYPDSQALPSYVGMHIPRQSLQAAPESIPMPYSDLQAAPRPVHMPTPLQHLQAPQSFADTPIPAQNPHASPSYVNMSMMDLSLPQTATIPMANPAIDQEYEPQLDSVLDGFKNTSGWMPDLFGTYGIALDPPNAFGYGEFPADPAMPSEGFEQGCSDIFGLETEAEATEALPAAASVAAMATPALTAPGVPLDPADDSNVPGMDEAAPQAEKTLCENQETAAGFGVSQLPPNDFDKLFEEWDADNAWDVLNQS